MDDELTHNVSLHDEDSHGELAHDEALRDGLHDEVDHSEFLFCGRFIRGELLRGDPGQDGFLRVDHNNGLSKDVCPYHAEEKHVDCSAAQAHLNHVKHRE